MWCSNGVVEQWVRYTAKPFIYSDVIEVRHTNYLVVYFNNILKVTQMYKIYPAKKLGYISYKF